MAEVLVSRKIFPIAVCCNLILFLLNATFFLPINSVSKKDSVYCPLQKTWVKREIPKLKFQNELEEICAGDKLKTLFSFQIEQKIIGFQPKTEKLFFDYLQKGDLTFIELNHHSNFPESNFAENHKTEKIGNNFQQKINKKELAKFNFQQIARPPTFREIAKFNFQITRKLENISHNISPRSPPFSI